jgi:hypothetical protein
MNDNKINIKVQDVFYFLACVEFPPINFSLELRSSIEFLEKIPFLQGTSPLNAAPLDSTFDLSL